jgi:hypothetical protein
VRTGAAVGAGFRVLGEGDLDADKLVILSACHMRGRSQSQGRQRDRSSDETPPSCNCSAVYWCVRRVRAGHRSSKGHLGEKGPSQR